MAIVFAQALPIDKLLNAYNNNVVRFTTDVDPGDKVMLFAEITSVDFYAKIYPSPTGQYYFNFKEYFTATINTKDFKDDVDYQLDDSDVLSMLYDVNEGHFLKSEIEFKITFDDASEETETVTPVVLASVTQLNTFASDKIVPQPKQFIPLIPALNRNQLTTLKMWRGYPFEFTGYAENQINEIIIFNETSESQFGFIPSAELTSVVLTDGYTEIAAPFLGMQPGVNKFHFTSDSDTLPNKLNIFFETEETCGVYVKFLNRFGRWTHWLFSKNFFETRTTKYMGEIENDFENIEDTMSPTLQIGKISDSSLKVAAKSVSPEFAILLDDIFDSPKIMIFNGVVGQINTYKNWFETRLKTSSFQIKSPNKKTKNYFLEFDNPLRNTITL